MVMTGLPAVSFRTCTIRAMNARWIQVGCPVISPSADSTIQMLHDVRAGTMGGLSDVTLGSLVDGRWVVDQPRERRFHQLARDLGEYVSALQPSGDSPSAR